MLRREKTRIEVHNHKRREKRRGAGHQHPMLRKKGKKGKNNPPGRIPRKKDGQPHHLREGQRNNTISFGSLSK